MSSDKISDILEKQLKTLGKKIRIDILKVLYISQTALPFSILQKEILKNNTNNTNFSFHLNSLKKIDLITSTPEGYLLTNIGKKIMKNILSMEQVINDQNKTIMIRTSKYSKEPFNVQKIEEYLIKEGEMEEFLAKKIANEVKNRLFKSDINYLTAPLMREYINGVLLENGLEEVRHKLTRLGTPPYEVNKLFNSPDDHIIPENFIKKLGSDVSEQFLLLNLLPKELSDLYISGEIALLNLNYWSLRPLGFYVDTKSIMNSIYSNNNEIKKKNKKSRDIIKLILSFIDEISLFYPYLSGDLLLGEFNKNFLTSFEGIENEKLKPYFEIFQSLLSKHSANYGDFNSHLSLDFVYDNLINEIDTQYRIDNFFLNQFYFKSNHHDSKFKPLILFDYVNLESSSFKLPPSLMTNKSIFYNQVPSNLINSSVVKVKDEGENCTCENKIILDKILINLKHVAVKANQQDDLFYELLQEKIHSVFKLFTYKESLVMKKLNSLGSWRQLYSQMFRSNFKNWARDSIKSISFFGLNDAIKYHCGIELDRIEKSEMFALEIIALMRKLIEEKNENGGKNFVLSQPNDDNHFFDSMNGEKKYNNSAFSCYSAKIIRNDSALPLNEKIDIFKKFEKIIKGGVKFTYNFNSNDGSLQEYIDMLIQSKLHAFSINIIQT
ncbi:MAG: anaerobic ribonucleoside-triphosphate reductase [Promethearchaeota archaeon]